MPLVPQILSAFIRLIKYYLALGFAPPGARLKTLATDFVRVGYPFQFGLIASGALLLVHFMAFFLIRKRRKAPRSL